MKKTLLSTVALLAAFTASATAAPFAEGGAKFVGNITTSGQIRDDMGTYWNQITAENGCKWGSIHSVDNSGNSKFAWDNYDKCESAYNWAKEQPGKRHFKFHALVWGSQYPNFLCKKKNPSITVEQTKRYITEWFDAVAQKFPDLEYIDVVNEAIWAGDNYHSGYGKPAAGAEGRSTDDTECGGSYIIEALGGDQIVNGKHQYNFITNAFKMARERWPKAVLIYNDYNTLSWQKDEGIELIQTIVKNGAPVDAYGQQAHDCKGMSKETFESRMTEVHQKTGLPLFITEYDISEADDTKQKNDYANQIPFMWETEWVAGITIWGYINGATWASNTGLIDNGRDRAAMTWLKEYFAKNLDKGKNTTGLGGGVLIDPVPQTAFKTHTIPGKIEAEDFDVPGVGTGNEGYNESDTENHGDSEYRSGEGVDLYAKATGVVVGYNAKGEWLDYTINVTESGDYTLFAAVASASEGSSLLFQLDGVDLTDTILVPAATEGEENYDDYNKVSANVSLTAGTHILKMKVINTWFDIDYFTLVKGTDATDPEPITYESTTGIAQNLNFDVQKLQDYHVLNSLGMRIGTISAYGFSAAIDMLQGSSQLKQSGVYYLKNRATGATQSVRIVR
ncbi:MAG: endo-1,4-beta-xylanase [Fibrobacter sp.]|nr:endo-1,4-beta-xylanase [Fibrobacter sp.]